MAIVKLLMEAGANPDKKDDYGRTPRFNAAWSRSAEVVKVVLEHADVNSNSLHGGTNRLTLGSNEWEGRCCEDPIRI